MCQDCHHKIVHFFYFVLFFNVYLFLREREQGRGREREEQRLRSRLCADSREPDVGLELTNCSWTLNQLSHPGTRHLKIVQIGRCAEISDDCL